VIPSSFSAKAKDALKRVNEHILSTSNRGHWSYFASGEASTEATAWCGIACRHLEVPLRRGAISFLIETQNRDGGWSTAPKVGASDWCSGPATLALRLLAKSTDYPDPLAIERALKQSFGYLFDSRSDPNPPVMRLLILYLKGPQGLDYGRGWPWTPRCWNWVEPSSYNLLALKIPHLPPAEQFRLVVAHAHRYFLEHVCEGGGWNHGANRCLGHSAPAFAVTTAEALVALQDIADKPEVQSGLSFLENISHQHKSAMSSAWAILARNAYGHTAAEETNILLAAQNSDGSFGPNLMVTGLAAVALSAIEGDNPLIISKTGS
jgi:hypothetical protein